ncbi:MAG: flavodoxin [Spirochaetota bacterium]
MPNSKILIAYFTHSGNTKVATQKIQNLIGGDIFEIKPIKSYSEDYYQVVEIAKEEKRKNVRPELLHHLESIDNYVIVILGYPNWWGTMPMVVFTFLERHDFSGKIIAPVCTHEGSVMGKSESDIKRLCPHSKVLKGLAIRGGSVHNADKDITEWLHAIGILN